MQKENLKSEGTKETPGIIKKKIGKGIKQAQKENVKIEGDQGKKGKNENVGRAKENGDVERKSKKRWQRSQRRNNLKKPVKGKKAGKERMFKRRRGLRK